MPLMQWNDAMSVGVQVMDDEHKKLVNLLNDLYDGLRAGKGKESMGSVLDGLISYTVAHFKHEESLMDQANFPDVAAHKKLHADLTAQALDIQQRFRSGSNAALSLEIMNFLRTWLVEHIQGSDKKYSEHFLAHGIK